MPASAPGSDYYARVHADLIDLVGPETADWLV
jgi:hypothetical protein